jgi:hypothetical protein
VHEKEVLRSVSANQVRSRGFVCGGERIDRVPACKRWITNKIRIVLPSKYGNMRLKGWLCPYLCGIRVRKAR